MIQPPKGKCRYTEDKLKGQSISYRPNNSVISVQATISEVFKHGDMVSIQITYPKSRLERVACWLKTIEIESLELN